MSSKPVTAARTTIAVQGARVHNLKNISVEIPRDRLVVVTGLSGSGKSSLAFDTIYAEGQRRYLESLSSYAKRFVAQVSKPDVDFVFGLSPVISIEQKNVGSNPRSTVGTMTDIASYLNLLFATIAEPHCPRSGEAVPNRSSSQILEAILSLPEGTQIELRAPVFKVYGEELEFVFTEVRKKGCRTLIADGRPLDLSQEIELEASDVEHMAAQHVLMSKDRGETWDKISPDLAAPPGFTVPAAAAVGGGVGAPAAGGSITTLAPSPVTAGVIWAGTSTGLIHVTRDNGKTWSNVTPPNLPPAGINVIDASHDDGDRRSRAADGSDVRGDVGVERA